VPDGWFGSQSLPYEQCENLFCPRIFIREFRPSGASMRNLLQCAHGDRQADID
jgi:hypothetical protein